MVVLIGIHKRLYLGKRMAYRPDCHHRPGIRRSSTGPTTPESTHRLRKSQTGPERRCFKRYRIQRKEGHDLHYRKTLAKVI